MKERLEWKERREWKAQIEMWEVQMKDLLETSRPPATTPAAKRNYETSRDQHSTHVPPIRIIKSTKRLIDEGEYEATCVGAHARWNHQFHRWEAILEFDFVPPVPAGEPIPMHVNMGRGPEPELDGDHWLAHLLKRFGELEKLASWRFFVTVGTIKRRQGDKFDRPASQWYSRVKRAVPWDEYVTGMRSQQFSLSDSLS